MKMVISSIFPVREIILVATRQHHGSVAESLFLMLRCGSLASCAIVNVALSRLEIHLVRIYYFCLLFEVECLFVVFGELADFTELFLVERFGLRRVRIPYEPIVASGAFAIQVVSHWQLLKSSHRLRLRCVIKIVACRFI